jgi:hypothetical protein
MRANFDLSPRVAICAFPQRFVEIALKATAPPNDAEPNPSQWI